MPAENIYICTVTEAKLTGKMSRCLTLTKLLALRYAPSLKKVLSKQKETLDSSNTVQCNLRTLFWDCYQAGDRERWRKTNSTAVYKFTLSLSTFEQWSKITKKNKTKQKTLHNPSLEQFRQSLLYNTASIQFPMKAFFPHDCTYLIPGPWTVIWSLITRQNKTKQTEELHVCTVLSLAVWRYDSQWFSPVRWAELSRHECLETPSQHSYCRSLSLECTGDQKSPHASKRSICKEDKQIPDYCKTCQFVGTM